MLATNGDVSAVRVSLMGLVSADYFGGVMSLRQLGGM